MAVVFGARLERVLPFVRRSLGTYVQIEPLDHLHRLLHFFFVVSGILKLSICLCVLDRDGLSVTSHVCRVKVFPFLVSLHVLLGSLYE